MSISRIKSRFVRRLLCVLVGVPLIPIGFVWMGIVGGIEAASEQATATWRVWKQ